MEPNFFNNFDINNFIGEQTSDTRDGSGGITV